MEEDNIAQTRLMERVVFLERRLEESEFKVRMKNLEAQRLFDKKKSKWVLKLMHMKKEKMGLQSQLEELQHWTIKCLYGLGKKLNSALGNYLTQEKIMLDCLINVSSDLKQLFVGMGGGKGTQLDEVSALETTVEGQVCEGPSGSFIQSNNFVASKTATPTAVNFSGITKILEKIRVNLISPTEDRIQAVEFWDRSDVMKEPEVVAHHVWFCHELLKIKQKIKENVSGQIQEKIRVINQSRNGRRSETCENITLTRSIYSQGEETRVREILSGSHRNSLSLTDREALVFKLINGEPDPTQDSSRQVKLADLLGISERTATKSVGDSSLLILDEGRQNREKSLTNVKLISIPTVRNSMIFDSINDRFFEPVRWQERDFGRKIRLGPEMLDIGGEHESPVLSSVDQSSSSIKLAREGSSQAVDSLGSQIEYAQVEDLSISTIRSQNDLLPSDSPLESAPKNTPELKKDARCLKRNKSSYNLLSQAYNLDLRKIHQESPEPVPASQIDEIDSRTISTHNRAFLLGGSEGSARSRRAGSDKPFFSCSIALSTISRQESLESQPSESRTVEPGASMVEEQISTGKVQQLSFLQALEAEDVRSGRVLVNVQSHKRLNTSNIGQGESLEEVKTQLEKVRKQYYSERSKVSPLAIRAHPSKTDKIHSESQQPYDPKEEAKGPSYSPTRISIGLNNITANNIQLNLSNMGTRGSTHPKYTITGSTLNFKGQLCPPEEEEEEEKGGCGGLNQASRDRSAALNEMDETTLPQLTQVRTRHKRGKSFSLFGCFACTRRKRKS